MPKSTEILFRTKNWGRTYEGQRGNLVFELVDMMSIDDTEPTYIVKVQHKVIESLGFTTNGHRFFSLEKAKEFCQQIVDGEINLEALLVEFAAEDMAREEAVTQDATDRAKSFRGKLDKAGLTYVRFLELVSLHESVGDLSRNMLLEWEGKRVEYHG